MQNGNMWVTLTRSLGKLAALVCQPHNSISEKRLCHEDQLRKSQDRIIVDYGNRFQVGGKQRGSRQWAKRRNGPQGLGGQYSHAATLRCSRGEYYNIAPSMCLVTRPKIGVYNLPGYPWANGGKGRKIKVGFARRRQDGV
jgi:hypothetical protein